LILLGGCLDEICRLIKLIKNYVFLHQKIYNSMREHNKRWLMSMMKTSGSQRKDVINGRYADGRHTKQSDDRDDLPTHESIKATKKFYNGKINYGLLVRFLRGQVGNDWDVVYSEIISRIPTKLLDYKEMIFWFVADKVGMIDGRPWDKKAQQFIWTGEPYVPVTYDKMKTQPKIIEFYVDPATNKLVQIPQVSLKKRKRATGK
jgi:hypothetical protein